MIDEKKLIRELFYKMPCQFGAQVMDWFCELVDNQPKSDEWIPCSEQLPEEHDSMFARLKGTDKWNNGMFEKISNDVNVTVKFEDGKRKTMTLNTIDGKWKTDMNIVKFEVIAWQPLPEPYRGNGEDRNE